jgi:hypothetical protein
MRIAALALALLAAGCASTKSAETAAAPEAAPAPAPAPRDPAAEQAAWTKYMTPGEPHARMAKEVGTWDCAGKFWMDPAQPPMESKATAEITMIFGGRYQRMDYKGEFMGMPFDGLALTAYDNVLQKYLSIWIDSMGTGMMHMQGAADAAGVVHMKGEMVSPMGVMMACREEMISHGPDSMTMRMFCTAPGAPEAQVMELVFTRRK